MKRGKLYRCICVCIRAVTTYVILIVTDLLQGLQ